MNKKILFALAILVGSLGLTSCTTYLYTSRSAAISPTAIDSRSEGAEVVPDFTRRVTATSSPQITQSAAIQEAQFKCLQEFNIDVVVDPVYKIEFKMFAKNAFTATVIGYAGMYKNAKVGFDAFVEKNYSKEDIEKYKLLNDPEFQKLYYQKEAPKGEVTNYYINSDGSTAKPSVAPRVQWEMNQPKEEGGKSVMLKSTAEPKKAKKSKTNWTYQKSKQLRDAGMGLTIAGAGTMFIIGGSLIGAENYYENEYRNAYNAGNHSEAYELETKVGNCGASHIAMACVGLYAIVAGVPMWAVGQHRMNNNKKAQLAIGGTGQGLGMRLTF